MTAFPTRRSPQTLAVLEIMLSDLSAPWYGLQLSEEAGLKSGTIYPLLARLERVGLVSSGWEQINPGSHGRPRRRLYRLTAEGATAARSAIESDSRPSRDKPSFAPGIRRV